MLKQLSHTDLTGLLAEIAQNYALQVPTLLADGTRQLAPYGSGELSLSGERLQRKPTCYFFPQTEPLVRLDNTGHAQPPAQPDRPLALFGLDRTDLTALAFLDRFFSAPPADDVYLRNRQSALLIGLANLENYLETELAGEKLCDLEFVSSSQGWLALGYSPKAGLLLEGFPDADHGQLPQLSNSPNRPQFDLLQQASNLLAADKVPDAFWEEIAARCILCTGCNLACPTCSCFCVQDRKFSDGIERSRVWDSCQLDAFMREASGHNPLGSEALRTRRRIHHKLVADLERWGELGCVACGRCDRACPTGIGMLAVVEEMVVRFGD
jgi:formate hydrogenlyase subunit 6/NADH:ubiquinone oxidoreductase subunit I